MSLITQPRDTAGRFAAAAARMPEIMLSGTDRALESGVAAICQRLPGVVMVTRLEYEGIVLDTVSVRPRRQGLGTQAMQQLHDLADQMGLPVYLDPSPLLGTDLAVLVRFYHRLGYTPCSSPLGSMMRQPQPRTRRA